MKRMNYFPIIIQIIFLFCSLPSLIPFSVPLLSVCPCLCAVSSQKFGISGAQALSVFYTAHCTMGQSPFLMKILYYFCNNNTLLTHIDIYSLFIFKLKEKCELPDILIKNILGRDACGFLFYFLVISSPTTRGFIQNFTVSFIFLEPGWSLASTLSSPESCSCPVS